MMKPDCYNKFNKNSEFCTKVCKSGYECGGAEKRDEIDEIKHAGKTGILSMKEMCIAGMKAIEKRCENKLKNPKEDN